MAIEQFYCGKDGFGLSTFTLHLRVQRNITTNFYLHAGFQVLRKGSKSISIVTPSVINVCDLLKGNYNTNVIKFGTLKLIKVTKPIFLCPLIENTLFIINNYTLRPNVFPPYLPLLSFVLKVELYWDDKHYLDFIFKGRVMKAK